MGAWGHGYFEDDAALDFMADIEESKNPKKIINKALDVAIDADYLENDEGNAVIISATYIDRQLNGSTFSEADRDEPLDVDTFPNRYPDVDFSDLRGKVVQALQRLLGEESELKELWKENEEDYPNWRQGVEQLIQRLDK
jgi:hypothetical protein